MSIERCILIHKPVEEVFIISSNPANLPHYDDGIVDVKPTTEGLTGMGKTYQLIASQLGRQMIVNLEIIAYKPNLEYAFRVLGGPFPVETYYNLVSQDNSTKIIARREPQPTGIWDVFIPLMSVPARKKFEGELNNLKNYLESNYP